MAKVYVTEHTDPTLYMGNMKPVPKLPPLATQTVVISAGSLQSSAFNAKTKMIGVHVDAICSIEVGADPTATANSRRLAANTTEYFEVEPSHKIAVITNS